MATNRTFLSQKKLFYIGIAFEFIAALMTIFYACPTNSQYLTLYMFFGIGLSLIFSGRTNKYSAKYKVGNLTIEIIGGAVIAVFLIYYNPIARFKIDNCSLIENTITVFVHGKKGKQDLILRNQGSIILDRGTSRFSSEINNKGQAFFTDIHIGDTVRLQIDFSEPYKAVYPDSTYIITRSRYIYFEIYLPNIDKIEGTVFYNQLPLEGVLVKALNRSCLTDSSGSYLITIPDSLQRKNYTVWFIKKGYKSVSYPATPQIDETLDVPMEKQ